MTRQRILVAVSVTLITLAGCGQKSADRPPPKAPRTIKTDGQTWNRVESIDDRDQRPLARHFTRNPALAENPIFTGELVLYRGRNGRRFYWLSRFESDVAWLSLEFDDHDRFVGMREGSGAPF